MDAVSPQEALQRIAAGVMAARGVALPERELVELYSLLLAGHQRAAARKDLARFDHEVEVLGHQFQTGLLVQERVDGGLQVSAASIREVLRRLCPLWPFC